jgi:hypothetical protein
MNCLYISYLPLIFPLDALKPTESLKKESHIMQQEQAVLHQRSPSDSFRITANIMRKLMKTQKRHNMSLSLSIQ